MLRVIAKYALLIAFLAVFFIGYLVTTPHGTFLGLRLLEQLSQGHLTLTGISGRLISEVHIGQITYRDNQQQLDVTQGKLRWQPLALLQGKVHIEKFTAAQMHYTQLAPHNTTATKQATPGFLVNFLLQELILDTLQLSLLDHDPILLQAVYGSASLTNALATLSLRTKTDWYLPLTHTVNAQGSVDAFQFSYTATGERVAIHLSGTGSYEKIHFASEQFNLFSTQAQVTADIIFDKNSSWQGTLTTQGTNPHELLAALPSGSLNFSLTANGNKNSVHATLTNLQGTIAGKPTTGNLTLTYADKQITQLIAKLSVAEAQLALTGSVTDNWDLESLWHIPNLARLYPDLAGSLHWQTKITGPRQQASITSELSAKQLRYRNLQLNALTAQATLQADPQQESTIQVKLTDATYGWLLANTTEIALTGNLLKHSLALTSQIKGTQEQITAQTLRTVITGSWQAPNWQGLLSLLTFSSPQIGQWTLEKPTSLTINQHEQKLAPFCISLKGQQPLCIDLAVGSSTNFGLQITKLDIAKLRATIPALIPYISNPEGQITAALRYNDKNLTAEAQLTKGKVILPSQNIQLTNINADIRTEGKTLTFSARGESGNVLLLKGTIDRNTLLTQLTLTGTNILTLDTGQLKLITSPNLSASIDNPKITLRGDILIPYASLKPYDFSQTVTLSPDVVSANEIKKSEQSPSPWTVTTQINLTLGDAVTIDLNGLTGKLHGNLVIHDLPQQNTKATGQLTISNGSYRIYGQKLTLEMGELNYLGGSLKDPLLNITASKTLHQIQNTENSFFATALTVGAKITGTADKPKIELFSRPAGQSQADILSYLLLGTTSRNTAGDNARLLFTAANALTDSQGGVTNLTEKLKQGLGLSELTLGNVNNATKDSNNDLVQHSALVLGKYLSPKLYLSYSVGLLDPINIFRIQYLLNKNWTVQTESSTEGTGVDVLYHIDNL